MNGSKIKIASIIFLFLSLSFLFAGISYSIFSYFGKGMTNNVIQAGRIIFSYSEVNSDGNGIHLENAYPIPDKVGKILSGEGEYFDFSVSATTTKTNLSYEITVKDNANSSLDREWVKIYLTTFEGNSEVSTNLTLKDNQVVTFDQLVDTSNQALNGKTIYYGTIQAGEVAYSKRFRLRIWVKNPDSEEFDYSILNNKNFSLKVSVAATEIS